MVKLDKRFFTIFIFLIIPTLLITSNVSFFKRLIPTSDEFSWSMNSGWEYRWEKSEECGKLTLPCKVKDGAPDRTLWISNILPEQKFDNATLFLRTSQQYLKVYIDGKLIYKYGDGIGKSSSLIPGSSWHFIKLPQVYSNKKVEISLISPYRQYSGHVNSIYIGSESSVVLRLIFQYGGVLIISCIIFLFGCVLIVLYYFLKSEKGRFQSIFYLGIFSLLGGMWILSESKIIQLLINNPVLLFYVACISLFLLPIPLLQFIISTYKPKKSNLIKVFVWIFRWYFIIVSVLQIFNKAIFMQTILLFHILLLCGILTVIFISICEIRTGNKGIRLFFLGCFILCIFSIKDLYGFYFSDISGLNAQSSVQFAIFLFILLLSASLGHYILEIFNDQTRSKVYKALAYTDSLTGLKNRTSFDDSISEVNKNLKIKNNILIIVFDINNLKLVNDSLGHHEGDRLIYHASRLIKECFDKIGEIYRIGGDEFAVIVTKNAEFVVKDELLIFDKKIKEYNHQEVKFKISIAYGMASFKNNEDKDFHSVFAQADREMYKCKKIQKQNKEDYVE